MLRWLYIRLLSAHPAEFRQRFGEDMLEAFDQYPEMIERLRLVIDGIVSLFRQWVLRPEFHQPWQPSGAIAPVYELITFQQIEPYKPRGIALAQGGMLAILFLTGVVAAINHGGSKFRHFAIGMHRPGLGLIKVNRVEDGPLDTTVEDAKNSDDPWRPFARSYYRVIRVLGALDADNDLTLSAAEIANAPAALLRLDLNHDGKLSAEECGFLPGDDRDAALARRDFMRGNPVLAALDTDHDGEISTAEIANSPTALLALDIIPDGMLTPYELIPSRALARAAALMTRFDVADTGVITLQGVTYEGADAESMRELLTSADRDHDGAVTRGELIVALAVRPEIHAVPQSRQ
jgi:Ca2+-binding EF-hand superfamily protein